MSNFIPMDWFGTKRLVKRALSVQPVNWLMLTALRGAEPSETLARLPVAAREVSALIRDTRFVMTRPEACSIAKELFWGRGHRVRADERNAVELFCDLARSSDLVLDVGANTGLFSICAALSAPDVEVRAFEIVPEVFEVLFQNIVRNDLAHRISCFLFGIAVEGLILRIPSYARSSSLPTSASILDESTRGNHIRCHSLDTVLRDTQANARVLLKVDIEGAEDMLFENATRTLSEIRPDILCEVIPGTDPRGVIPRTLKQNSYRLYRIEHAGLRPFDELTPSPDFHDWLFSPKDASTLRGLTRVQVL